MSRAVDTVSVEFMEQARRGLFAWYAKGVACGYLCNIIKKSTYWPDRVSAEEMVDEFLRANPQIKVKWTGHPGGPRWEKTDPRRRVAALAMYHWLGAVAKRRLKEGSL